MLLSRMRLLFLILILALATDGLSGQGTPPACSDPVQVVQAQVEAYNRHDLDAFVATYAPDAELRALPVDSAPTIGQAAMRQAYAFLQKVPQDFGVDITERMASGCFVIYHEFIRATSSRPAQDGGVVIYQVEDRLIRRVWFVGG
jgi:hypothetical protein